MYEVDFRIGDGHEPSISALSVCLPIKLIVSNGDKAVIWFCNVNEYCIPKIADQVRIKENGLLNNITS